MRRHAKASSAGSISTDGGARVGYLRPLALLACAFVLCLAGSSSAATITERPLLFTFAGTGATGPFTEPHSIAVDNATGDVYVGNDSTSFAEPDGRLLKFDADGNPVNFSATGSPVLPGKFTNLVSVAVDNSGGSSQGRLLVSHYGGSQFKSFAPSGELQWTQLETFGQPEDIAVDTAGHPWTNLGREYANTGSPPANIFSLGASGVQIEVDANENVYLMDGTGIRKYVGGVFDSFLDPRAKNVYADQSSSAGHIFTVAGALNETQRLQVGATAGQFRLSFSGSQTGDLPFNATAEQIQTALEALPSVGSGQINVSEVEAGEFAIVFTGFLAGTDVEQASCEDGTTPLSGGSGCAVTTPTEGESSNFREYAASGAFLGAYGSEIVANGVSIAYNPSLDRVYVLQGGAQPSVAVFGSTVTSTVADTTIDAPSAVGVSTAHFSGTVNPQGTNSEWHFEWRKSGQGWSEAGSSPAQSLPADSSDHTVEYTTNALRGNSAYQVRLVAVNTTSQLAGISASKNFTTSQAAQAPAVTIAAPSAVTTSSAKISGTVNPQGDTADWRVQLSTDPACAGGFVNRPLQAIAEASSSPVDVEFELSGLIPAEHYCARILATNSAGNTTSSTKEFETQDISTTQVFTAFTAPRTDTTARVNGYVNPQGSDATYRFEYSQDGSSWTVLPDKQTKHSRRQIIVAGDITGLQPNTLYHYRFEVENDAGAIPGAERTFKTRTSAEMQLAARGIELVNQPAKGNQNLTLSYPSSHQSIIDPDGNKAIWSVEAGAPGSNTGTGASYLASRSAGGWKSTSLVPPASKQIGGGDFAYILNGATPDFSKFVFRAGRSEANHFGAPTLLRLDRDYNQDVLKAIPISVNNLAVFGNTDFTADASRVFFIDPSTGQLEELGNGSPRIVSMMPDGTPSECELAYEGQNFYGAGTGAVAAAAQWRGGYHRIATTDGSRVYFQAVPNGQPCSGPLAIFYRDLDAEQTTEIDPGAASPKSGLIRATPDGRSIYFVTKNSHSVDDQNSTGDIYRWDAESGDYTCLTCVVPEAGVYSGGAEFSQILISDDFSHVYFGSHNQLVSGYGRTGDENLYSLSNGQLKFVTDLSDLSSGSLEENMSALSTDGNVLVFKTSPRGYSELTADPVAQQCETLGGGSPSACEELYRYEDSGGTLECISCRPNATTVKSVGVPQVAFSFKLSPDGSTIGFSAGERLLPQDINNGYDVYQWHSGAIGLITDGETIYPSGGLAAPKTVGIDDTGDNIFIGVISPGLTGYEQDKVENFYDSRVGGGFPRPSEPAHCSEESCQGPLQAAPAVQVPSSSAFLGAGNEAAKPARKGRCAGRRGKAKTRCQQQRHKRHSQHHKSQHKAGGSK